MSRYIDAEWLKGEIRKAFPSFYMRVEINTLVNLAPSIDIVHCQDCKHWVYNFNGCSRNPCTEPWYATDFCSYGERKEQ